MNKTPTQHSTRTRGYSFETSEAHNRRARLAGLASLAGLVLACVSLFFLFN